MIVALRELSQLDNAAVTKKNERVFGLSDLAARNTLGRKAKALHNAATALQHALASVRTHYSAYDDDTCLARHEAKRRSTLTFGLTLAAAQTAARNGAGSRHGAPLP